MKKLFKIFGVKLPYIRVTLVAGAALVGVHSLSEFTFAQPTSALTSTEADGPGMISDESVYLTDQETGEVVNPIDNYKGWSTLYKSYDKSPIIFDKTKDGRKTIYPRISYYANGGDSQFDAAAAQQMKETSLQVFNLGVDDEVSKATMSIYQPINLMNADFANDAFYRGEHLGLAQTLRGLSLLTLSYLDKTVSAGLATAQAQVDSNTTNQLLKQLNWTQAKIANPQRAMFYRDVDEKVEACLKWGPAAYAVTRRVKLPERDPCPKCASFGVGGGNPGTGVGRGGVYAYCVCCAETWEPLNSASREGTELGVDGRNADPNAFSLVSRAFFGIQGPLRQGSIPSDQFKAVEAAVQNFRDMYGDIIAAPCQRSAYKRSGGLGGLGGVTNGDTSTCVDGSKIEFVTPELSVADKVALYRNGLNCSEEGVVSGSACPRTGTAVKEGICPALKEIFTLWPPNQDPTSAANIRLRRLWVQASLGTVLTARAVKDMFKIMGVSEGYFQYALNAGGVAGVTSLPIPQYPSPAWDDSRKEIRSNWWKPVSGRFRKFLDSYCDAAAVAALKKFHSRVTSITEDHLALNQVISEGEKKMFYRLIGRVSSQIELAERDLDASSVPDRMLAALGAEADGLRVSEIESQSKAMAADFANQGQRTATDFNGRGYLTGEGRGSASSTITYDTN